MELQALINELTVNFPLGLKITAIRTLIKLDKRSSPYMTTWILSWMSKAVLTICELHQITFQEDRQTLIISPMTRYASKSTSFSAIEPQCFKSSFICLCFYFVSTGSSDAHFSTSSWVYFSRCSSFSLQWWCVSKRWGRCLTLPCLPSGLAVFVFSLWLVCNVDFKICDVALFFCCFADGRCEDFPRQRTSWQCWWGHH